jgi:serine/threonine protein kinase
LKPDNIMMTSLNAGTRVVVADFGQAKRVEEIPDHDKPQSPQRLKRLFSVAGSFPYRAPEIERREADGYSGKAADMWTIGIIAAVTLSGDGTFGLDDVSQEALPAGDTIMKNAARANLRKSEKAISWRTVGPRPKDFIKKLVTPDVEQRLTAEQALQHCWFTNSHHAQFFEDLYKFGVVDRWKQRPLEDPLMVQLQQSMVPGPPQCGDFLSMRPDPHDQQEDDHDTVAGLQQPSVSKTMRNPRCEETDSQCLKPVEQAAKLPLKVRYELPELPSWSQKHAMRPSKRDGTTSHFFPKAVH